MLVRDDILNGVRERLLFTLFDEQEQFQEVHCWPLVDVIASQRQDASPDIVRRLKARQNGCQVPLNGIQSPSVHT